MYIFLLMAVVAAASDTASHRRLIIDGGKSTINQYPYIVALMFCKPTTFGVACASFCSGSLIATDVVLTAGHCVYDLTESAFGAPVSSVPLDNMFALVGSGDWKQLGGSRLIKVKQIVNRGYGRNLRYPFDDDVGLVFLSECVELVPGRISTIPIDVATKVSGTDGQCRPVTSLGFGRSANVPSEISVHDGVLRHLKGDFIHSHETCQGAYVEAHMKFSPFGVGEEQVYNKSMLALDISSTKHICSGGNSMASTCFGDSGGPVVAIGGNPVVAGVVSFGPLSECMISPDFAARVSTYASWILSQIEIFGKKCSPIESSFSTWPLPAAEELLNHHEEEEPGRCPQWQCARSGECLSLAQVCDGNTDCNDGSDEDPYYCRVAYHKRSKDSHGRSAAAFTDGYGVSAAWTSPIGIEREFDALVEKAENKDVALFHGSGTVERSEDSEERSGDVSVTIIGVLDSVVRKARTGLGASPRATTRSAINTELCGMMMPDAKSRFGKCTPKFHSASRQMMEEIDYGSNRFEHNPDPILNVCKDLNDCVFNDLTIPAYAWLDIVNTCSREANTPQISSTLLGIAQFCGERIPYFMSLVASRQSYADTFLDRFGESHCLASLPERVGAADKGSRCRGTLTIVYIFIALIVYMY